MKKAGFESGKCEGSDCSITMVGDNAPPGSNTAQVVKDQLTQLGFKVNLQSVNHDVMYTKFCGVPANTPNVCPNVGWVKDFNDPQSILDVPFNGEAIVPSNNSNWPLLDDKSINEATGQGGADQRSDPAGRGLGQDRRGRSPRRRPRSHGSGTTRPTSSRATWPA